MQFENEIVVAGAPEQVIDKLADVPLMTSFLPGASVGVVNPDGSYPATLVVSFGPKRIAFNGTVTNQVDKPALSGVLTGQASADVRGARMAVTMTYQLSPAEGSKTNVRLLSQAQLTGVLAEFAKTGGVFVTNAILAEFASRFSAEFSRPGESAPPQDSPAATLSAGSLLATVFRTALEKIKKALARLTGRSPVNRA